jgi:hypothetical protein
LCCSRLPGICPLLASPITTPVPIKVSGFLPQGLCTCILS